MTSKEGLKTYLKVKARQGEADYQWERSKQEESEDEARGVSIPQHSKKLITVDQENNS